MESKSHESDELTTVLINSVETLSNRIDKLEDQLKTNNDINAKTVVALTELNTTVLGTNKVFDEVSEGIKGLYEKVKQLEIWGKLLGNIGSLGPLLGGLGGLGGDPKK
jgi:uncharacterized coiled-coil protein SlyX